MLNALTTIKKPNITLKVIISFGIFSLNLFDTNLEKLNSRIKNNILIIYTSSYFGLYYFYSRN